MYFKIEAVMVRAEAEEDLEEEEWQIMAPILKIFHLIKNSHFANFQTTQKAVSFLNHLKVADFITLQKHHNPKQTQSKSKLL